MRKLDLVVSLIGLMWKHIMNQVICCCVSVTQSLDFSVENALSNFPNSLYAVVNQLKIMFCLTSAFACMPKYPHYTNVRPLLFQLSLLLQIPEVITV